MANWIWLLAATAMFGNASDRTIIHFSTQNCPACRKIQPVIEQLHSEGWSIRSIDSEKDPATTDRWRVRQFPTVIVLENGREVDRVVGSLELAEYKRRLTGNELPNVASKPNKNDESKLVGPALNSNYGPNHPLFRSNRPSNSNKGNTVNAYRNAVLVPSIGVNHPYYSLYKNPPISSSDFDRIKPRVSRAERRVPTDLPELLGCMAATVRIRLKYEENESVGTGTIIDMVGDDAFVLTCGHLFRSSDRHLPMTVELFDDGESISVSATLVDFRDDEVDLGLIKFRSRRLLSKVRLLPKGEALHEQESVFSIGCDAGNDPSRRDTVITKLNRFLGPSNIEIAGAPVQGRSGGGLFDSRGRLIGVCIAADNELDEGMFVGPEAIYAQLEKQGLNRLYE